MPLRTTDTSVPPKAPEAPLFLAVVNESSRPLPRTPGGRKFPLCLVTDRVTLRFVTMLMFHSLVRATSHAVLDRWVNFHPLLRGLLLLAAAAAIGYLAVGGPYQKFRAWRMAQDLLAARSAVEERSMLWRC